MQSEELVFSKEQMPALFDQEAKTYRKTALTRALRIFGPFTVETSEGPLRCEDGYLAVDARGYPYPIATDEFELIYKEADAETNLFDPELRDRALQLAVAFHEPHVGTWQVTSTAKDFYKFLNQKEESDATTG